MPHLKLLLVPVWLLASTTTVNAVTVMPLHVASPAAPMVGKLPSTAIDQCQRTRALNPRGHCGRSREDAVRAAVTQTTPSAVGDPARRRRTERYLVIGSFNARPKADDWARYNEEFVPTVIASSGRQTPVYRVVVGPLTADSAPLMRAILSAAGIYESWFINLCVDPAAAGTDCKRSPHLQSVPALAAERDY